MSATLLIGLAILIGIVIQAKAGTSPASAPVQHPVLPQGDRVSAFRNAFLVKAHDVAWGGIDPRMALAVASFETGDNSPNSIFFNGQTNNLFNISKGSWSGATFTAPSGQVFRRYATWQDSMRDWVVLMHTAYYAPALPYALSGDSQSFFKALKELHYDTTDPSYAADLQARYQEVV